MKVVVGRKAFEFNWSGVEARRAIYIREIRNKVTHEATISKNGAEWLAKKLLDATDFWCRCQIPQGRPRWVDSMGTLELEIDYNDRGHFIKAEIWSSSDNRAVCMYFPKENSCRGWLEVGETLFTFISGHNVNKEGRGDLKLKTLAMQVGAGGVKAGEYNTRGVGGSKSLVGKPEPEMSLKHIQEGATKLVLDTPSSVAEWKEALVFTLSDDCNGWGWLMEAVKNEFSLTLEPKIKPFSAIKAVVQITDKLVRQRMLNLGRFEVGGVSVIISAWDPSANTLSEDWFNRKKRWMNILGLPFHLWSEDNITAIGGMVGKVIDIHEDTLSLKNLDSAKVLIEVDGSQMNNNELELYEGGVNYKLKIFPEIAPNDIGKPWKVLHALQKDGRHGVDNGDVSHADESPTLGTDKVSIPGAVNETDSFPGTSKTAGVLRHIDESRDQTTPINKIVQTLDLNVGHRVDDSPNGGAGKEAGQSDLDQNILDLKQQTAQVGFMVTDLNEPILSVDLCEGNPTEVATDLESIQNAAPKDCLQGDTSGTGKIEEETKWSRCKEGFMVTDLNEPILSVDLCEGNPTEVATDLESIQNAFPKDCLQGDTSETGKIEEETKWSRWKEGKIQTYQRNKGRRNDGKVRNIMFPTLRKQMPDR